jgi:hypothetical protein
MGRSLECDVVAVALQILASGFATGAVYGLGPRDLRGAPLLHVELVPGSDATPGLRSTSIIWGCPQCERFLGNPGPAGSSTTVYVYRSGVPPPPPVAVQATAHDHQRTLTIALAAGVLLAAEAGLAVWARA